MNPASKIAKRAISVASLLLLGVMPAMATPVWTILSRDAATASSPEQEQEQAQPANPETAKSSTFTGIILKEGTTLVFKDSSGAVVHVDDTAKAQPFEGKAVRITGKFDTVRRVLHIESIEGAS